MLRLRRLLLLPSLALAACPESKPAAPLAKPSTAPASRPVSRLAFEPLSQHLGTVVWPGSRETSFRFRNDSDRAIGVLDVIPSCGCSQVKLRVLNGERVVREAHARGDVTGPLLVVEPREQGELRVLFETRTLTSMGIHPPQPAGPGALAGAPIEEPVWEKVSYVTIVTNEKEVEPARVFFTANIDRPFEIVPSQLAFEAMGAKQTVTKEAKILVLDRRMQPPFDARIVSTPPGVTAGLRETAGEANRRATIDLDITAGPGLKPPFVQGNVVVEAKLGTLKQIEIPVYVQVSVDLMVKPTLFDFQAVEADKPAKSIPVTVRCLDPDRKLRLGTPKFEGESSDRLALKAEPIIDAKTAEGQAYRLTLTAEKGLPAAEMSGLHGIVRMATGLDDFPELKLEYRAFPRVFAKR